MTAILVLSLLLGAGWLASRGMDDRILRRGVLALFLGLGSWSTGTLLVGHFVKSPILSALVGGGLAVAWSLRMGTVPIQTSRFHPGVLAVWGLLTVAAWLHLVGGVQILPPQQLLVFDLPKIAQWSSGQFGRLHPLGASTEGAISPGARLLAFWGLDPLVAVLVFGGLAQVGALWLWFWNGAREQKSSPLASILGGLALFLATSQGWMLTISPWMALSHLLFLWVWAVSGSRSAVWTVPALGALLLLAPSLALAALGFLVGRTLRPQAFPFLALSLASLWFYGASWGILVAAYLYGRSSRREVRGLSLASLAVPGALEWSALGLVVGRALTALWRRIPQSRWGWSFGLTVPKRFPIGLLAVVAIWRALIAGEEVYNDDILIRAQKEKASLARLFVPHRLLDWASWRGEAVGLKPQDLEALPALSEPGEVLYQTGEPIERIEVSALLSTLSGGRAIDGWYASERGVSPFPAIAAYYSTDDPELLRSTPIRRVLRRGKPELSVEPWPEEDVGQAASVVPVRTEQWGRRIWYRADGATGYEVEIDGQPFGPEYPVRVPLGREIPYVPPLIKGEVKLLWSGDSQGAEPPSWPLVAELKVPEEIPTRSLLTVQLELENLSDLQLRLDDLRGLRWTLERQLSTRHDEVSPVEAFLPVTLEPNSSKTLTVDFRTPAEMGTYKVHLEMLDSLGRFHSVELRSPTLIRTWRRHPLVSVPDGVVRVTP